jgi:hypothetical protein
MDLYSELLALLDVLEKESIEYALCGGVAVAFHGYPRFTKDIDILVRPQDLPRVKEAVARRGFVLDSGRLPFGLGTRNEREVHRISKVEGKEVLTLDLVLVNQVLDDVWNGRERFEWQGRQVQVVSREGLAVMKRLANRRQDLLDLEKLGFLAELEPEDD